MEKMESISSDKLTQLYTYKSIVLMIKQSIKDMEGACQPKEILEDIKKTLRVGGINV